MNKSTRVYWIVAISIVLIWAFAMQHLGWWSMFSETWPISLTMVLGSFIAGATAEGGGAVAFPVFTKMFGIAPQDARIFAFMIQSFGMTMAGLFIYLKKIPVLWNVIGLAFASGSAGLITGELFLNLPDPYPKILFSFIAAVFGIFLIYNRWILGSKPMTVFPFVTNARVLTILISGFIGGMISSVIGVGIDMVLFIVLTLMYGLNEKVSTPTTVVLMGLLSVVGFTWHGGVSGLITPDLWRYWMSCVPIVIFGAPFGAWVCSKINRDHLIYLLLLLISVDLVSTAVLIPLDFTRLLIVAIAAILTSFLFLWMIHLRNKGV